MSDRHDDLRVMLHARGFRSTTQRQLVLEALGHGHAHCSAEEVFERVHKRAPNINRSTVYRTLAFLSDMGVVSVSDIAGQRVFELVRDEPHHHLVCRECGKVDMLDAKRVASFLRGVAAAHDYAITTNHLVLYGVCAECRKKA